MGYTAIGEEVNEVRFYSKALDKEFETNRIVGEYHGQEKGPVLVFFGGIHGNEPAGVIALINAFERIHKLKPKIKGSIYGICGNMRALAEGKRFLTEDLNRIWTRDRLKQIGKNGLSAESLNPDIQEQIELYNIGRDIFKKHQHQVYCIDLHTTSAVSEPFITMNDTLLNRSFSKHFPVPVVLGIEEYLNGPLLNWVVEIGYPCLAFEAGSHHSPQSIENAEAFICLSMVFAQLTDKEQLPEYKRFTEILSNANHHHDTIFEIRYKREISDKDGFEMKPGYVNFQRIEKDEVLATDKNGELRAAESGRIFMPLYQSQGNDAYFRIREIAPVWLKLSAWLRKVGFETLLTMLPGVNRDPNEHYTLVVNRRVARFLATEIFHLLGYRNKKHTDKELRFSRREYDVRGIARIQ